MSVELPPSYPNPITGVSHHDPPLPWSRFLPPMVASGGFLLILELDLSTHSLILALPRHRANVYYELDPSIH